MSDLELRNSVVYLSITYKSAGRIARCSTIPQYRSFEAGVPGSILDQPISSDATL